MLSDPRFRFIRRLGRGASSEVLLVEDRVALTTRAIKLVSTTVRKDEWEADVVREFLALSSVLHPSVVRVHDLVRLHDGRIGITMEAVEGPTINKWARGRTLPELAPVLIDVADALEALHRRGLIHRDLTGANVLIRQDGSRPHAILVDFGFTSQTNPTETAPSGTLRIMPPEVLAGRAADARADLFAFGVLLGDILSEKPLWEGLSLAEVSEAKCRGDVATPPLFRPEVPQTVRSFVRMLLAPHPAARPRTGRAVAEMLRRLLAPNETETGTAAERLILPPRLIGRADMLLAAERTMRGEGGCVLAATGPPHAGTTRLAEEIALRGVLGGRTLVRLRPPYSKVPQSVQSHRLIILLEEADRMVRGDPAQMVRVLWQLAEAGHQIVLAVSEDWQGRAMERRMWEKHLSELRAEVRGDVFELTGLSQPECAELIDALVGGRVPPDVADAIYASTAGRPGEVVDVLDALLASGVLLPRGEADGNLLPNHEPLSHWVAERSVAAAIRALPSVHERVLSDVRQLLPEDCAVLALVLLLEDAAREETVRRAAERLVADAESSLARLVASARVVRVPGADARLVPASEALAEAALQTLPLAMRRVLHARTLRVLADEPNTEEEASALATCLWHAVEGGAFDEARRLVEELASFEPEDLAPVLGRLEPAAQSARTGPADLYESIEHLLARSAEGAGDWNTVAAAVTRLLARRPVSAVVETQLRLSLAWSHQRLNRMTEAQAELDRVQVLLPEVSEIRARYWSQRGWLQFECGNLEEAERSLCTALAVERLSPRVRIETQRRLGAVLLDQDKIAKAETVLTRALEAAHSLDVSSVLGSVVYTLARCYERAGRYESIVALVESCSSALTTDDPAQQAYLIRLRIMGLLALGRDDQVEALYEDACARARASGSPYLLTRLRIGHAVFLAERGDVGRGLRILEEAERLAVQTGPEDVALVLVNRAYAATLADEPTLAQGALARLEDLGPLPVWLRQLAHVHHARLAFHIVANQQSTDVAAALADLAAARALAQPTAPAAALVTAHISALETEAHLLRGDLPAAAAALEHGVEPAEMARDVGVRILLLTLRAELAVRRGRLEEADGTLEEALALARARRRPAEHARTLMVLAERYMSGAVPDVKAARSALTEAIAIADAAGARALSRRALHALASLSPSPGVETRAVREEAIVSALAAAAQLLAAGADLARISAGLLDLLLAWLPVERALVLLRDPTDADWTIAAQRHVDRTTAQEALRLSETVLREAQDRGDLWVLEDATRDPSFALQNSVKKFQIRTVACVPLRAEGEVMGLLYLDNRTIANALTTSDLALLRAVAAVAALALRQATRAGALKDERDALASENQALSIRLTEASRLQPLLGESDGIREVRERVRRVARTDARVLIMGETGVGKDLVARMIHGLSTRRSRIFLPVNSGAIPQPLIEAELFGIARGVATDIQERPGYFELANGGTLFLDEIANLPLEVQGRLLRILEDSVVTRVGRIGTEIKVDVRVIAATNAPLVDMVNNGQFREDLYYRLRGVEIVVPPLRERLDDIPLLAHHFLAKLCAEQHLPPILLTLEELDILRSKPWKGNVRELMQTLERALLLGDGTRLDPDMLREETKKGAGRAERSDRADEEMRHRQDLIEALERTGYNRVKAAKLLDVSEATVRRWITLYNIPIPPPRRGRPPKVS
jgi:Nif-specific regulatory protein